MTFEQWWAEVGSVKRNRLPFISPDMLPHFEACWDMATENASIEAHQIRKAVIGHYGALPDYLDKFIQERLVAIRANNSNNS